MLMRVLPVRVNNDMDNYEWLIGFVFWCGFRFLGDLAKTSLVPERQGKYLYDRKIDKKCDLLNKYL